MISVKLLHERAAKRQKIRKRQSQYNEEMVKQTRQPRKAPFKIDAMVAIKIDRVDKTSPVHPNMLLGKIMEIRKDYAKIVTPQGISKGFISFSRLYPCTSSNATLDYFVIIAKKFRSQVLASKLTIFVSSICSVCK